MGFQRELVPFGGVFRGNAPKSTSADVEIPYPWKRLEKVNFLAASQKRENPCKRRIF